MKPTEDMKATLLAILRDGNAWSMPDLHDAMQSADGHWCGCEINNIVRALRADGHQIECFRSGWAIYKYRLLGTAK